MEVLLVFILLSLFMLIGSKTVFAFWVGKDIEISYILSGLWMSLFIIQMFNSIFFHIINGSGKIKLQMIVYSIGMIVNIPLSIIFAKTFNLGTSGVILATVICQLFHTIYLPVQYRKIVNKKDTGIWAK